MTTAREQLVATAAGILRVPRDEFLTERWHYRPGEHVTVLGPTQSGKTTLCYQLLRYTSSPTLPGVVLVMKPRDQVVSDWTKALGYRLVRSWPPAPALPGQKKSAGWVLWPRPTYDLRRDNAILRFEFSKAIADCYKRGNRILFGDEMWGIAEELNLDTEVISIWTRGAAMGCGLWAATQKPTHIPLWAYSQAEHLFLHNDPDDRAKKRFDEIGGVEGGLVRHVVGQLPKHAWLYIRRAGPQMCIVEP